MAANKAEDLRQEAKSNKQMLLDTMRHEVRTSLNHIVGYSEILLEEAEGQGQQRFIHDVQRMHAAAGELLRQIEEHLDLADNETNGISIGRLRHQLRAPLIPIIGYSEMLEEDADEQGLSDLIPDLQKIRIAAHRCLVIVNEGQSQTVSKESVVDPGVLGTLSSDRLLGLLALTIGRLDDAAGHFEDAVAFCRHAGYRLELAWTCCDYADLLRERGREGDRDAALSLLDESLAISRDLDMDSLVERVVARRGLLTK